MDAAMARDLGAQLEMERTRLLGEVGVSIVAPEPMTYGSQAAAASQVFDQQRDLALRDRAVAQLAQVQAALSRIQAGSYGTCVRCLREIAPARLEALPWAAHCIGCQSALDRGRR